MEEKTLRTLIEGGREAKRFSQRELARRIGLSNTSLNDLEKGKVQKPDIEILRKIAEELDLSLKELLSVAGYNELTTWVVDDEFKNKSSKDLKNIIKEARAFKYDILDWDAKKRAIAGDVMGKLDRIAYKLELINDNRGTSYTLDEAVKDIKEAVEELDKVAKKYDYSKLPYDV